MFPSLEEIWFWLQGVINQISSFVNQLFKPVADWLQYAIQTINSTLSNMMATFKQFFIEWTNTISTWITNALLKVQLLFQQIVDFIWGLVGPVVDRIAGFLQNAYNFISTAIAETASRFFNFISSVTVELVNKIGAFLAPLVSWFSDVSARIKASIDALIGNIGDVFATLREQVIRAFDSILNGTESFAARVETQLKDVSKGFTDAADVLVTGLSKLTQEQFGELTKAVELTIKPMIGLANPAEQAHVTSVLSQIFSPGTLDLKDRAAGHALFSKLMSGNQVSAKIMGYLVSVMVIFFVYKGIVDANAQVLLQEFSAFYHYQLPSPADCAQAMLRGELPRDEARKLIVKQGYSPQHADLLLDNVSSIPPVGELLSMLLREQITSDDFSKATVQLGLSQKYENAYRELANIIPPIGDLIHFAVKGAFSESEIAQFGYMDDFPKDIVPFAKKQGLSEFWMERYWASHWQLPSATQGFEMLQRGEIGEPELKILLRALDYPPAWREKLINISYNVLTRVDVRRLHQLGLMDRAGLVRAHKNMGYSPQDAELLTTFVEELNSSKPGEAAEDLSQLSRTNIVGFYKDGTITNVQAKQLLVDAGYTEQAAELFITNADFENERVERSAQIDFIVASAVAGALDFGAAQDELARMNLSPTELDRAVSKLLREQGKRTKLPSVDDGTKMFKAKVITESQYRDLLGRLGYRAEWAQAYVELAKKG